MYHGKLVMHFTLVNVPAMFVSSAFTEHATLIPFFGLLKVSNDWHRVDIVVLLDYVKIDSFYFYPMLIFEVQRE